MSESSPLVTVGVCTYKRPEGIAKCLRSLIDQHTSFPFDIVVTENDASQGSKAVIEQIADEAKEKGIEIRYYCEPEPNISIARNRCVAECRGEFLAFIDDDEWAEPDWLEKLVEVQREYNADVVYGTVIPEYEPGFPEYLKGIRDYQHMFHEGQKLESAASGCTMYRLKCLQFREGPFDLSYGKTGGEDSELAFYLFQIHNILIIKTFKAIAQELQPASRGTCRYYWKRSYRESYIAARLFNQYYYRMAGLKVNGIHFFSALKGLLINCFKLIVTPRRAFAGIGMNIASMAGIIAFYLGRKTQITVPEILFYGNAYCVFKQNLSDSSPKFLFITFIVKSFLKRIYRLLFGKIYADMESRLQYLEDKVLILQSGLWDEEYYIRQSGWGRRGDDTPLDHYIREGWKKGFNPSERFDGAAYMKRRPDLPINPLSHYLRYGRYPLANVYKPSEKTIADFREAQSKRQAKKVVYTCITNRYDDLSQIACFHYTDFDWDYVCFTDDEELIAQQQFGIWDIRPLVFTDLDVIRNARRHKILAHCFFPEYEESLYLDANVNILTPWLFEEIQRRKTDFLIPTHFALDCLYKEYEHVLQFGMIDPVLGQEQIEKYRREGFPANYGLNETNILYRRHNDPAVVQLMDDWANEIVHFTQRDQLSLSYVMWKHQRKIADYSLPNARIDEKNFCVFEHVHY